MSFRFDCKPQGEESALLFQVGLALWNDCLYCYVKTLTRTEGMETTNQACLTLTTLRKLFEDGFLGQNEFKMQEGS